MTLNYVDTGDRYRYPNAGSYRSLRGVHGGLLKKGTLFSMTDRSVTTYASPTLTVSRVINESLFKTFQYNPAEVAWDTNAVMTDPPSADQPGGTVAGIGMGMGSLRMSIQLQFTRDQEVFAGTNANTDSSATSYEREIYSRVGVQKDIYDLYRVIIASPSKFSDSAGGKAAEASSIDSTQTLPEDVTMSALTLKAFDLATAGSFLIQKPVAMQINPDMIFYGFVTSFSVTYNKFNYNMVPTWAKVGIGLDVMNVRPSSAGGGSIFGAGSQTTGGSNVLGGASGNAAATVDVGRQGIGVTGSRGPR